MKKLLYFIWREKTIIDDFYWSQTHIKNDGAAVYLNSEERLIVYLECVADIRSHQRGNTSAPATGDRWISLWSARLATPQRGICLLCRLAGQTATLWTGIRNQTYSADFDTTLAMSYFKLRSSFK